MITLRSFISVMALLTLGFSAESVRAQSREESSRFDPRESVKRMDANRDGRIDQREIPIYMRRYVERAAEESGLNMNEPMSVDQLGEAMAKQSSDRRSRDGERSRSEGDRSRSEGSRSEGDRGRSESGGSREGGERSSSGSPSKSSSLVPGFGDDPKLAKPPGFDVKPSYLTSERGSSSAGSSSGFGSGGSSSTGGSSGSDRGKLRRYAESLMKQYDSNNNGVLEKNEWDKMSGSPKKADGNNDDSLTLDELTDHVARLSGTEPTTVASGGGSSSSPSGSSSRDRERGDDRSRSSGSSDPKAALRFLTPTERLPKGLPDWFVRNDADGDGQIAMVEFTMAWSYDKAGDFIKYDRDGDGFVTPAECLIAEKEKKR